MHEPLRRLSSALSTPGRRSGPWRSPPWLLSGRTNSRTVATVSVLKSWDVKDFRLQAFTAEVPAILPRNEGLTPPAISKWFLHDQDFSRDADIGPSQSTEINHSFWSQYGDLIVPLEVTRADANHAGQTDFDRLEGPLNILLADLKAQKDHPTETRSIYLAQHDLRDLPPDLRADLPVPDLVRHVGKGDLYSSSLWLGRSPTYTPLHRDPNPNLLMQLAGTKTIRLFAPEVGSAIFEHAQQLIDHRRVHMPAPPVLSKPSASFRGEEMMKGAERTILHDLVWSEAIEGVDNDAIVGYAQDATLTLGQALFIPKGWWHSVKGIGSGVTASANWWFR